MFKLVIAKLKVKIFYLCINLGCLSPTVTTEMERSTGFWTAYLLCLCFFVLGVAILIAGEKYYVVHPPKGSIIINAFKAMWIGLRNGGTMGTSTSAAASAFVTDNVAEAAKPSYQIERGRKYKMSWDDVYIDELKRGLAACRVFLFYPIYWVAYSQMLNNFISQGEYWPQKFINEANDLANIDDSWYHATPRHPQ